MDIVQLADQYHEHIKLLAGLSSLRWFVRTEQGLVEIIRSTDG